MNKEITQETIIKVRQEYCEESTSLKSMQRMGGITDYVFERYIQFYMVAAEEHFKLVKEGKIKR